MDLVLQENKNLIIIEGIDGVGKSTLAQEINIKHFSGNWTNIYHEHQDTPYDFESVLERMRKIPIFDRSVIGEHVWSKVFRRPLRINTIKTKEIFDILKNEGYKIKIILKMTNLKNIPKDRYMIEIKRTKKVWVWNKLYPQRKEIDNTVLSPYNRIMVFRMFQQVLDKLELDYEVIWAWK